MSDYLTIDSVKNALVECPICTEYFHANSRIPRRMPCCNQTICELCLETYSNGRQAITCPLCCQQINIGDGVRTLPREMVVLRFLDLLETQSNFFPVCTDCPDKNTAIGKCDTCRVLLCEECLKTHHRNSLTEDHITATFERARREQQARRNTVRQSTLHPPDCTFDEKAGQLGKRIDDLQDLHENILESERIAEEQINQMFDDLTQELRQRRIDLLSQLRTLREMEAKDIKAALDSHQILQFQLQKATRSRKTVSSILFEENPQDVDFVQKGISFVASNAQQLSSAIRGTGVLRSVTYTPTDRPKNIDEASHCNAVDIDPPNVPQNSSLDQVLVLENIHHARSVTCPHLELDSNTNGEDVTICGSVVTNTKPKQSPLNTGCRLKAPRTILVSKPFIHEDESRYMYAVKVNFRLIQGIPLRKAIVEIALTANPIDMNFSQIRGMSISLASCHFHVQHKKDLCLVVETNVDRIYCSPLAPNEEGMSGELNIGVMVDYGRKTIHVLDIERSDVLATVHDMAMDKPLWTMIYLGRPEWTDIKGELVSGQGVKVSREMMHLLSNI